MKKYFVLVAILLASMGVNAQQVTAPEPEFVNSYYILTSDSTFAVLPKENGTIGEHQNKTRKWSKIIGGASHIVGAAGVLGAATAGSMSGVATGARVFGSASSVGTAADAVNGLAGSSGMDIIFKGGRSAYQVQPDGKDVRLIIKAEKNETDPMDCYRIVRFNASKKERRIQWMEFDSSVLGSKDSEKAGYVAFSGHKYGEQSYLLTIPVSELEKGEYGVFYLNIATAVSVPVGTFGIK